MFVPAFFHSIPYFSMGFHPFFLLALQRRRRHRGAAVEGSEGLGTAPVEGPEVEQILSWGSSVGWLVDSDIVVI